jgi:hypothetical protein
MRIIENECHKSSQENKDPVQAVYDLIEIEDDGE